MVDLFENLCSVPFKVGTFTWVFPYPNLTTRLLGMEGLKKFSSAEAVTLSIIINFFLVQGEREKD